MIRLVVKVRRFLQHQGISKVYSNSVIPVKRNRRTVLLATETTPMGQRSISGKETEETYRVETPHESVVVENDSRERNSNCRLDRAICFHQNLTR